MSADWMLNDGIVNMKFDLDNKVTFNPDKMSFTKDYNEKNGISSSGGKQSTFANTVYRV